MKIQNYAKFKPGSRSTGNLFTVYTFMVYQSKTVKGKLVIIAHIIDLAYGIKSGNFSRLKYNFAFLVH